MATRSESSDIGGVRAREQTDAGTGYAFSQEEHGVVSQLDIIRIDRNVTLPTSLG